MFNFMALLVVNFILSCVMGDTHRSMRFFVFSGSCRGVTSHVAGRARHKIAMLSNVK